MIELTRSDIKRFALKRTLISLAALIVVIVAVWCISEPRECITFVAEAHSPESFERTAEYSNLPLDVSGGIMCKCNDLASAGFRLLASGDVRKYGSLGEEPTTTWRITIKGDVAKVVCFSGASQQIEEPELFSVERTLVGGLLLISKGRGYGHSPQVITIDPRNSSFVYSSQSVGPFSNRANVFYGSCVPAY